MNAVKKQICHFVELMNDNDALLLLDWVNQNIAIFNTKKEWDDIEEVEPDEWDLEMIADINNNPECVDFTSDDESPECLLSSKRNVTIQLETSLMNSQPLDLGPRDLTRDDLYEERLKKYDE